jgi:hypothetical protein
MSFELYLCLNEWFLELGTTEVMVAPAYLQCTWNIICCNKNTSTVRHKHLIWHTDAVGIAFGHQKNDQEGDSKKKLDIAIPTL